MKTPFMHRRHFLQAVSGAALAFPWFSGLALQGADASKAPRRLVCIGMDFGVRPESFFPSFSHISGDAAAGAFSRKS